MASRNTSFPAVPKVWLDESVGITVCDVMLTVDQMSLGTSIAYLSSIALLVLASKDSSNTTYFDSVIFLSFFVITGRYIEALSRQKTADTISELKKLRPVEALLEEGTVPIEQLEVGDRVLVPLGACPPTDGIVIAGATYFDESSLTGEARPVHKRLGDQVFAGTINKEQVVTICVTGGSTYNAVISG
jgi:P-type Cu+ transporter